MSSFVSTVKDSDRYLVKSCQDVYGRKWVFGQVLTGFVKIAHPFLGRWAQISGHLPGFWSSLKKKWADEKCLKSAKKGLKRPEKGCFWGVLRGLKYSLPTFPLFSLI